MSSLRPPPPDRRVAAVIAARDEAARIGATVTAVRSIPGVYEVVVVADGSVDGTVQEARRAGARVLSRSPAAGKGAALEAGLGRTDADVYLLLDGDVGRSAGEASRLLDEVLAGRADLAIGVLPIRAAHGGFRLVKRFAGAVIRALCGFRATEPLSGQRAVTQDVLDAVRPLAPGFSAEVAMTIDAVRAGFRVVEVPIPMYPEVTGRHLPGFIHRGKQGWAVLRAALPRAVGLR